MRRSRRYHSSSAPLLVAIVLTVLAAGCNSGSDSADTFEESGRTALSAGDLSDVGAPQATAAVGTAETAAEALGPGTDEFAPITATPVVHQISDLSRDVIFNADLTVAVSDVAGAGEQATRMIQGIGGFLFGQRTVGPPEPTSVLTFKVAPEDFQEALSRLGSLGEIRAQNVSADDVTERIVDLESRINTAAASVDRLRGLLENATDIKAIVELENELLARETQLETLRGQLRTLQDQVALATIVLSLTEAASRPAIDLQLTAYPAHDDGLSCPGGVDLRIEQATEATVCFEITNVGDTSLTDFELHDPVLDVEIADLIVVFGDPTAATEPGQSIILAAEVTPERTLRTQTTVTAQPVDEDGEPLPGRPAASTTSILLEAVDPGGIPSFSDGLRASLDLLVGLAQMLVLSLGALIPFLWVPLVLWLLWRVRRTRLVVPLPQPDPSAGGSTED
jgi:Domain of unknown function (DUF4349)